MRTADMSRGILVSPMNLIEYIQSLGGKTTELPKLPNRNPKPMTQEAAALPQMAHDDRAAVDFAVAYLISQGARRVWLFGSLAKGRAPTVHSDFDFAVEGLPSERFYGCIGYLLQALPRPVDLVELESASDFLKRCILEEGLLLA